MANFQWAGFGRLMGQLAELADPDASDLMEDWERIIVEDNRHGVLLGLDRYGNPMPPVTYRPTAPAKRVTKTQKNGTRGVFAGLGPHAAGLNNNLTPAEYKRLAGPPLAPRGPNSRVITNLFTGHGREGGTWFAVGAWAEVVSTRGIPFLVAHFTGATVGRNHKTKLPVRDLTGVRPWGRQRAVAALQQWGRDLLKGSG